LAELGRILEGKYVYLRDVKEEDLPEIIRIRTNPELSRFIHPINPDLSFQINWLKEQKKKEGDYYFVIIRKKDDKLIGTCGIYNITSDGLECEIGRLVSQGKPFENLETLKLCYEQAFGIFKVTKVHAYVVEGNEIVINLHKRLGYELIEKIPKGQYSEIFDVYHFILYSEKYEKHTLSILNKVLYV